MGDEVRVTVIAAGFDRWDDPKARDEAAGRPRRADLEPVTDVFGDAGDDDDLDIEGDGDDFDVPSFLK
jgi:cell division protein FtsZ